MTHHKYNMSFAEKHPSVLMLTKGNCDLRQSLHVVFNRPVRMLMYVTLNPAKAPLGLVQETAREDSVTLLKTISVAGSGPGEKDNCECKIHKYTVFFAANDQHRLVNIITCNSSHSVNL